MENLILVKGRGQKYHANILDEWSHSIIFSVGHYVTSLTASSPPSLATYYILVNLGVGSEKTFLCVQARPCWDLGNEI